MSKYEEYDSKIFHVTQIMLGCSLTDGQKKELLKISGEIDAAYREGSLSDAERRRHRADMADCGLELPKHTFYVDNIFVYEPLPLVRNIYYMDVDLYRYFIGRADQSVNESVMMGRVDQQLRVNYHMIDAIDLREVAKKNKKLAKYMFSYLAMMMAISSIFLTMDGSPEALGKRTRLWEYLRTVDQGLYTRMRYFAIPAATNLPTAPGRRLSVALYRLARRIYKFN